MTSDPERLTARFSMFLGWARYDHEKRLLEIDFKGADGSKSYTYAYPNFPREEWEAFRDARHRGLYFRHYIRPRYKGTRVWWARESGRAAS